MAVALLVLSFAMIVGGLFAVVLGWDIVLVERGWAMVIAGSVCAGSGAVLLGLAAAVGRLGRIRAELASFQEDLSRLAAPVPPAPVIDPLAAVSSGPLGGGAAGASSVASSEEAVPDLPAFLRPGNTLEESASDDEERRREKSSGPYEPEGLRENEDQGPAGRAAERSEARGEDKAGLEIGSSDRPSRGDDALPPFQPEDQADRVASSTAEAEPSVGGEPLRSPEPAKEPQSEPETEPGPERSSTVIGTYNSGDNRYVMFSDGSIEAETPDGVFRFNSLDELKEFIASGGEGGSGAHGR